MKPFEILLKQEIFKKGDILESNNATIQVIDTPKPHYNKWYYKILNYLTFKQFFNIKYTYTVKIIEDETI